MSLFGMIMDSGSILLPLRGQSGTSDELELRSEMVKSESLLHVGQTCSRSNSTLVRAPSKAGILSD